MAGVLAQQWNFCFSNSNPPRGFPRLNILEVCKCCKFAGKYTRGEAERSSSYRIVIDIAKRCTRARENVLTLWPADNLHKRPTEFTRGRHVAILLPRRPTSKRITSFSRFTRSLCLCELWRLVRTARTFRHFSNKLRHDISLASAVTRGT